MGNDRFWNCSEKPHNLIIDTILNRRESKVFTTEDVEYIIDEAQILGFDYIIDAFKSGDNARIREALCRYVDSIHPYIDSRKFDEEHSDIKDFINTVKWVPLGGILYDRWE